MAGLAVVLLLAAQVPGGAAPPWPGLPDIGNSWAGTQTSGVAEVAKARQWARIPNQAVAFVTERNKNDPVTYAADDPQQRLRLVHITQAFAFFSSPTGAEHGYGESFPFTVRTVAFGAVPVEAEVQLAQVRDGAGLPVPLTLNEWELVFREPQQRPGFTSDSHSWAEGHGELGVRIRRLSVDGVDLALEPGCRTVRPAELVLSSKSTPEWADDPALAEVLDGPRNKEMAQRFADLGIGNLLNGGALPGTVDIPAFSGCRTASGEDLSRLVTGAVSGPGNQVTVGVTAIGPLMCTSLVPPRYVIPGARAPFSGSPEDCDPLLGPPDLPLPTRTD